MVFYTLVILIFLTEFQVTQTHFCHFIVIGKIFSQSPDLISGGCVLMKGKVRGFYVRIVFQASPPPTL